MFKKFLKTPIGFKLSALWLFAVVFVAVSYDLFPYVQWDQISDFSQGDGPFKVPGHILGTSYD